MSLTNFRVKAAAPKRTLPVSTESVKRVLLSNRGPAQRVLLPERADEQWPLIDCSKDILTTAGVWTESKELKSVRIPVRSPMPAGGNASSTTSDRHLVLDLGEDLILTKVISGKERVRKVSNGNNGMPSVFTPCTAIFALRKSSEPDEMEKARELALSGIEERLRQLVVENKGVINDPTLNESPVFARKLRFLHCKADDPHKVPAIYVDVMPKGAPYAARIIEVADGEAPQPISLQDVLLRDCVWTAKATVILDSIFINPSGVWAVKCTAVELVISEKTQSLKGTVSRFFPGTVFVDDNAYSVEGDSVRSLYESVPAIQDIPAAAAATTTTTTKLIVPDVIDDEHDYFDE